MQVALIAAVGLRGELGFQNRLLCHLPADLQRFRELTSGHPVVMGRRTWESLPVKPLPGRRNLVLTTQAGFSCHGAETCASITEVWQRIPVAETLFVIGGESVYQQFMKSANTIFLTRIQAEFQADVFFPTLPDTMWKLQAEVRRPHDEQNGYDCLFQTFVRIGE